MKKIWAYAILITLTLCLFVWKFFLQTKKIGTFKKEIDQRNSTVDNIEKAFTEKILQSKIIIKSKKEELKQNTDKLKEIKGIENVEERNQKLADLANDMGL